MFKLAGIHKKTVSAQKRGCPNHDGLTDCQIFERNGGAICCDDRSLTRPDQLGPLEFSTKHRE
jgi:hypothetical protein